MKVREVIKMLEADGWHLVRTRSSHRQFKHPAKPGKVTVPGHLNDEVKPGTLSSILRQAGLKRGVGMRYAVVIEKAETNYSAYVPDLPGCVTTGPTVEETVRLIQEAIEFHLEGMLLDGESAPPSTTQCRDVEIDMDRVRAGVAEERAKAKAVEP
jgi:predicted RNA binding protein YcfA (HicA-like mRNA interferase family)/predicted RNase H-like HicB family nuclease